LSFPSPANSAIRYALVVAPYHMTKFGLVLFKSRYTNVRIIIIIKPAQSEYVLCPLLPSSSSCPPSSCVTLSFQDIPSTCMLLVAICDRQT